MQPKLLPDRKLSQQATLPIFKKTTLHMRKFNLRKAIVLIILTIAVSLFSSSFLLAQDGGAPVHGNVTDSTGKPISGASVMNLKSKKGTSTDAAGNFSISAVKGQTLQISFVGYQPVKVVYSGQASLTISLLLSDNSSLGNVIVIGYGTQRKEAVTGSVASIGGNNLREVPAANISTALQGRLPGVAVTQTSSQPGATMQIRIRGTRSLTANNDPLIVLDGIPFPGSIADIDMNDVKSLDILKDASATAIYGSRGANGVILITTNKGNMNQEPRVAINGYYGVNKVFSYYPMMNGTQFAALRKAAGLYKNQDGSIQLGADEKIGTNTNWQKLLYQTGKVTNEDISVSGGTKKGSYSFGASYYNNQGVIPTQSYQRFSVHGSVDQRIGNYVRLGFTTNSNYNYTQGSQVGLYNILSNSPLASPYNANGSPKYVIAMPLDQQWVYTRQVVDSLKDKWLSQNKNYASYNSVYGEIKIPGVEGLAYRVNVGLNISSGSNGSYTAQGVNSLQVLPSAIRRAPTGPSKTC